jgi:branched-chain amino acid aminotransferase
VAERSSLATRVAIDGRIVDTETAQVSVFDRGFLYGDGVFETLRSYGAELFRLEQHVERLAWSCSEVLIDPPLGVEALTREVRELTRALRPSDGGDVVLRLMISRGEGLLGLDVAGCGPPTRVLFVSALEPPPASLYERGVEVVSSSIVRPSDSLGGAKVSSYLPSIVALAEARRRGAHEALIVSREGYVLEGATSNLFALREGVLCTPPTSDAILPGITRQVVMELARGLELPVEERRLSPGDLASAEEVWLSSSVRELVPVVALDGFPIADARVGPWARRLLAALRALAAEPSSAP